jgi:hypothetical protein
MQLIRRSRLDRLAQMSACGTSRRFAAMQQFGRFRREAEIQRAAYRNGLMRTRHSKAVWQIAQNDTKRSARRIADHVALAVAIEVRSSRY